ncbi:allophanate hydrolase subunit 1 [Mycobacterium sp. 21AC1]|nr:allophanate hydrolase subunit 1 [Mycobacterium sp. 21AC1]
MVHRWAAAVRTAGLPGIVEVVPGLATLLVTLDPDTTTADAVRAALSELAPTPEAAANNEHHVIEVRYDGEDLDDVARITGLTVAEVIAAHTGTPWRVAFCGFAPGFSYLVGGDPRLRVPRRDESRVRVPAGAVAIAGEFSSIYPRGSPGGWQLLGHTDAVLWDAAADPPAVLAPGAVVQFREAGR